MVGMSETPKNLPKPTREDSPPVEGRVLPWPRKPPEVRVSSPLLEAVNAYMEAEGGGHGRFPTPLPGVSMLRQFQQRLPMRQLYRPSICIVLQGAKDLHIGEDTFSYGAMECLAVGMELPATGHIVEASPDRPYIGMTLDIDIGLMREVLEQLDAPPAPPSSTGPCVFVRQVDEPLADCVIRLIKLCDTPKAIPILYPSIMREICYWLLTGEHGGELCKLAIPETSAARIRKAIYVLHADIARTLRVEQLAEAAGMGVSSFHQHFKTLTSMSPLQFQKQLRLIEARRLMVTEAVNVTEAAYQVGYESASQFSREYSRMFGVAPKKDVTALQQAYADYVGRTAHTG